VSTATTLHLQPRSWRLPIILAVIGVATFVAFGLLGRDETTTFRWSDLSDAIVLESTSVSPRVLGIVCGLIALVIAGLAFWYAARRKRAPVWMLVILGAAFLVALVTFVGAGGSVPVEFLLTGAIGLSTAIVLGALAGVVGERVGVVNIAIEAQLLGGAFVAAILASTTGNFFVAIVAAMITGALISMVLAAFSIKYQVDQIIVGVVLIVLVTAITNFLYSSVMSDNSQQFNNPGTVPRITIPWLSDIPVLGPVFFDQRITTYLMFVLVPLTWFVLFKTRCGLRVRALGEHPLAADTVGIRVNSMRFWTVSIAGLIAGLGGASLTIGGVGAFVREMSAGQGFIALAAVILGRWNPWYAALAALLFGFSNNFRIWAGQVSQIPPDLIAMTPYVVTILAVALVAGRVLAPRAVGKPYVKS
jgi:ABC-type uncharacterized transport system permease subunit